MKSISVAVVLLGGACASRVATPLPNSVKTQSVHPSTIYNICIGAQESMLFFNDSKGQLQARTFPGGEPRWTSAHAGRVIHCDDEFVLTFRLSRGLVVEGFDASTGHKRFEQFAKLPGWVSASSIGVDAWTDRKGYGISWSALTSWEGGYPPSPDEEEEANKEAKGSFVFKPGGVSQAIGKPKYKRLEVPEDLTRRFATDGDRASISWDRRYVVVPSEHSTKIVTLEGQERSTLDEPIQTGTGSVYVSAKGATFYVTSREERDAESGRTTSFVTAQSWDATGRSLWKEDLRSVLVPDNVP